MKKCLIVLGMHRSGTSAMAGFLNQLGIPLGSDLLIPNEFNEKGYFENSFIVQANDEILQALDSSWDDLFPLDEGWWQHAQLKPHREAIKNILVQEFAGSEIFCIKDPRISILLPLWTDILQELNIEIYFIIPLRHPVEVAESLKTRDGFSMQKSLLLWMNNMLSIEKYSRPFKRCFFRFDDFLADPRCLIRGISDQFNIDVSNAQAKIDLLAKAFLDPKLKHHNNVASDPHGDMLTLINRFSGILFSLPQNGTPAENQLAAIDEILDEYKKLISMFYNQDVKKEFSTLKASSGNLNRRIVSLNETLIERDRQIERLNQTVADYDARIAGLNQTIAERDGKINGLNAVITECNNSIMGLTKSIAERDGRIAGLQQAVVLYDKQVADSVKNAEDQQMTINELYMSTSWRLTRPLRGLKSLFLKKST